MITSDRKSYPFSTTLTQRPGSSVASNDFVPVLKGSGALKAITFISITNLTIQEDGSVTGSGFNAKTPQIGASFNPVSTLKFASFSGKGTSVPAWVGFYTMGLINPDPAGPDVPAGAGFASLSVAKTGKLTFTGKLGDGTKLTGSALPTANGDYSLYASPTSYLAGGYFSATINLTRRGTQLEPALWNKPVKVGDKSYAAGFSTTLDVIVQPWLVPAKGTYPFGSGLGFGSSKNFAVTFSPEGLSDGNYSATLPDTLRLTGAGVVQAVAGGVSAPAENNSTEWNKLWKVKLNSLTGQFSGTLIFKHLDGAKTVTRVVPVEGVMLLDNTLGSEPFGLGQYVVKPKASLTSVSGQVSFVGPLEDNSAVAMAGSYTVKLERLIDDDVLAAAPYNGNINAAKPAGAPNHGTIVPFVIAEDLQSVMIFGKKLPLVAGQTLNQPIIQYWNFAQSPTNHINVTVMRKSDGGVDKVLVTYTKITVKTTPPYVATTTLAVYGVWGDNVVNLVKKN